MNPSVIVLAVGVMMVIAVGFRQRSRREAARSEDQLTLLLFASALGGSAVGVVADLALVSWAGIGMWVAGIPVALIGNRALPQDVDKLPTRCSYRSYLWELPAAVVVVGVGYQTLVASSPWIIRTAGAAALLAGSASLLQAAVSATLARRSGIGWIHYEVDADGLRFPSRTGERFVPWRSVESVEQPKTPHGLDTWFRPFGIRFKVDGRNETFTIVRAPDGYSFDQAHELITAGVANASSDVQRSSC